MSAYLCVFWMRFYAYCAYSDFKYAHMFWCVFDWKTRNQHGQRMKYANGEKAMLCYRKLERWLSVRAAGLLVEIHWFGTSPLPSLGWRTVFLSWKGAVCVAEILNAKWRRASNLRWCIWNQRSWIQLAALFSFRTKGELSAIEEPAKEETQNSLFYSYFRIASSAITSIRWKQILRE